MTPSQALRQHGIDFVATRKNKFTTRCPRCNKGGYLNVEIKKDAVVWFCHNCEEGGGEHYEQHAPNNGGGGLGPIKVIHQYPDENGQLLFETVRFEPLNKPKVFRARQSPEQKPWSVDGVRRVLFRLDELVADIALNHVVFVVEGEKDVNTLRGHGIPATTNPFGAVSDKKQQNGSGWLQSYSETLRGADVVVCGDNDEPGREHVRIVARELYGTAGRLRVLDLAKFWPEIEESDDISDWFAAGHSPEGLWRIVESLPDYENSKEAAEHAAEQTQQGDDDSATTDSSLWTGCGVTLEDFYAYMPMGNSYIFAPTGEMWPGSSIDARIPKFGKVPASKWLSQNRPVEQISWMPGKPNLIKNRLIAEGGFIAREGVNTFNLYRPPRLEPGDPNNAGRWLEHLRLLFPDDYEHIIKWLAHRVQRPAEKINHALLLGGAQGIGKDSALEPVKRAIGSWNFVEVSPQHMLGRFNGYLKSVILRVSEARDLGEFDQFKFYDHMKAYIAAPPDVLRVDEKHVHEYAIPNVCGVIITTNHKTDGVYLSADDRRHFVAWSELVQSSFEDGYWARLWHWYCDGGDRHVAAYLAQLDLGAFDPKAPPRKTAAFWEIVDASRSPEDAEMQDAIDALASPDVLTLDRIANSASPSFAEYLRDRKNARRIPHRLESCGYVAVRNDSSKDGRWKVNGRNQTIYAKAELSPRERTVVVHEFIK